MKPKKGNVVVILDKDDYHKKMDEILEDTSKFELLDNDAVIAVKLVKRENQVKALLKKLKSYPIGTRIGILYGLPKIHKVTFYSI